MKPRFAIVAFPGSNCEGDVHYALTEVLGVSADIVWHRETSLEGYDACFLPGGFAHGDYLRPGAIARFSPIMRPVAAMAEEGKAVIGVCNGFQVLMEAGLLPGAMLRNASLTYICQHVRLRVDSTASPLTCLCREGELLRIPIGHADGNFFASPEALDELESSHRVVLRYVDERGDPSPAANPNGSLNHIAGIMNARGNVVGLMPHLDRAYQPELGSDDGRKLFESLIHSIVSSVSNS